MAKKLRYLFLEENLGRKCAVISSSLLITSSNLYTLNSLRVIGNYAEPLFTIAMMYFFFKIFLKKKSYVAYFSFGLLCGFYFWFTYINLIMGIACGIYWFIYDRYELKKRLPLFVLGVLIGLLPWFYYNFARQFSGLDRLYEGFFTAQTIHEKSSILLANARELAPHNFPALYSFTDVHIPMPYIGVLNIDKRVLAFTYHGIFILSFIYLFALRRRLGRKSSFILFFICLFYFVYISAEFHNSKMKSSFDINYCVGDRDLKDAPYLVMLIPFIIMTLSTAIGELLKKSNDKLYFFGELSLITLISIGILGNFSLVDSKSRQHSSIPAPPCYTHY